MTTDFRIHIATWNVGETDPIQDFTELLHLNSPNTINLYAIGMQELKSTTAQIVSNAVFDDSWTLALTECLAQKNYVRIKSMRLIGMLLVVFVRRSDLPYISNVEATFTRTGFGGYWGNKGTVTVRLDAYGVNICLVSSHFQAHPENFAERIEDYNMTVQGQRFQDENSPTILDHDYVFWFGDLNFRIDLPNEEVRRRILTRDFETLKKQEQLLKAREKQLIFIDFEEEPLTFPPTFKFDTGTDNYDTSSKNRIPSWCDRILYLVHEDAYEGADMSVRPVMYKSLESYRTSDHKPVIGQFIIQVLKNAPELPVMFEPLDSWVQTSEGKVSYVVNKSFNVNSRDWVGLYKSDYKHINDYLTYVWASTKGEDMKDGSILHTVKFDSSYLQKLSTGTYYLCYYSSNKDWLIGFSDQLRLVSVEESSESSEDNDNMNNDINKLTHHMSNLNGASNDDDDDYHCDDDDDTSPVNDLLSDYLSNDREQVAPTVSCEYKRDMREQVAPTFSSEYMRDDREQVAPAVGSEYMRDVREQVAPAVSSEYMRDVREQVASAVSSECMRDIQSDSIHKIEPAENVSKDSIQQVEKS